MTNNRSEGANVLSRKSAPKKIETIDGYIAEFAPRYPVSILKPDVLKATAQRFKAAFPGRILYAVKCNPDVRVLKALIAGGTDSFDCASIGEVKLIRRLMPQATIYFMHPIKSRESIREAYFEHGVRAFVLDSMDELHKIVEETMQANDLTLFVRMAMPKKGKVATDFSAKFGAPPILAGEILKAAREYAYKLGVSFHVGTHCLETETYANAVRTVADVADSTGVKLDALDIGGGYPADLDMANPPPPIEAYFAAVTETLAQNSLHGIELLCEPGRGMVAAGGQLVVRVEGRKGDLLFINDGTYGGIFEGGGSVGLPYPARMIRVKDKQVSSITAPFRLAGPTCDSVDMMQGPFHLPEDINEGDYIVLDQLGAYGEVSRTPFNGFDQVIDLVYTAKKEPQKARRVA